MVKKPENQAEAEAGTAQELEPAQKQPQSAFANLDKSQKITLVVLAFFSLLIMALWYGQFRSQLSSPFALPPGQDQPASDAGSACTGPDCPGSQEPRYSPDQDTDQDGLSDYDEANVYQTSPFLPDTDSDGINDKAEIDAGDDPNCPLGQDCNSGGQDKGQTEDGGNNGESTTYDQLLQIIASQSREESNNSTNDEYEQTLQALLAGELGAGALRELLLRSGMNQGFLDQMSDQELMESYEKSLQQ